MTLATIGLTIHTAGTLCIGFSALAVHHRVATQAIIDHSVTHIMMRERKIGFLGLALVVFGYFLQII